MLLGILLGIVIAFVVLGSSRGAVGRAARERVRGRDSARRPSRAAATLAPPETRPSPFMAPSATSRAVGSPMPSLHPELEFGRAYTRREIHTLLGGGLQDYLPHVGGRVVCGCFNPKLNPHAPFVVLPGHGPDIQRWAYVFASQDDAVPCFLKRAGNLWEYVGDYRVRTLSEDPEEIAEWSRLAGREDDVSMVLHLEDGAAEAPEALSP